MALGWCLVCQLEWTECNRKLATWLPDHLAKFSRSFDKKIYPEHLVQTLFKTVSILRQNWPFLREYCRRYAALMRELFMGHARHFGWSLADASELIRRIDHGEWNANNSRLNRLFSNPNTLAATHIHDDGPFLKIDCLVAFDHDWMVLANELLSSTPEVVDWEDKLTSSGIRDFIEGGAPYSEIVAKRSVVPDRIRQVADGLAAKLTMYALWTEEQREIDTRRSVMLARLRRFLLASDFAVLRNNEPETLPMNTVKVCLGYDSDDTCNQVIDTVIFLNHVLAGLCTNTWDNLMIELLLICQSWSNTLLRISILTERKGNKDIEWFFVLARAQKRSLDYLVAKLTEKVPQSARALQSGHRSVPMIVPFLIEAVLKNVKSGSRTDHVT